MINAKLKAEWLDKIYVWRGTQGIFDTSGWIFGIKLNNTQDIYTIYGVYNSEVRGRVAESIVVSPLDDYYKSDYFTLSTYDEYNTSRYSKQELCDMLYKDISNLFVFKEDHDSEILKVLNNMFSIEIKHVLNTLEDIE